MSVAIYDLNYWKSEILSFILAYILSSIIPKCWLEKYLKKMKGSNPRRCACSVLCVLEPPGCACSVLCVLEPPGCACFVLCGVSWKVRWTIELLIWQLGGELGVATRTSSIVHRTPAYRSRAPSDDEREYDELLNYWFDNSGESSELSREPVQ